MAASFGRIDSTGGRERHNVAHHPPSPPPWTWPRHPVAAGNQTSKVHTGWTRVLFTHAEALGGLFLALHSMRFKHVDLQIFAWQTQQMNYSFMRRVKATPATSVTVFVDFTPLPTASEPMNQLDFPPQSKQIFVQFISAWVTVAHRRTICSPKNIVWICEITHLKPRRAFQQLSIKRLTDKHAVRGGTDWSVPPCHTRQPG